MIVDAHCHYSYPNPNNLNTKKYLSCWDFFISDKQAKNIVFNFNSVDEKDWDLFSELLDEKKIKIFFIHLGCIHGKQKV